MLIGTLGSGLNVSQVDKMLAGLAMFVLAMKELLLVELLSFGPRVVIAAHLSNVRPWGIR